MTNKHNLLLTHNPSYLMIGIECIFILLILFVSFFFSFFPFLSAFYFALWNVKNLLYKERIRKKNKWICPLPIWAVDMKSLQRRWIDYFFHIKVIYELIFFTRHIIKVFADVAKSSSSMMNCQVSIHFCMHIWLHP